ncbi:Microspherule protein 1 [Nymphaea thermarum]|nr:Microspherule protein 1 [Nymphaea thermarum]
MGATVPYFPTWIPEDDLLLKNAVEAGASLESLAKGAVQFSRRFSIKELRERWHALLYHPEISAEAAARMVELELSASNAPKFNKLCKVKGQEVVPEKRKVDNVRSNYYATRKKICNDSTNFVDSSYHIPQGAHVGFMGSEGSHLQEQMNELAVRNCVEGTPIGDNFRATESGFDIGSQDFSQLERVGSVLHGFHASGAAPLTNDLHDGNITSTCLYGFTGDNISSIPVENAVAIGISSFDQENLEKDFSQILAENPVNFQNRLEIQETSLQQSMEMNDIFVDHDLEVKPLPEYDSIDRKTNDTLPGFGKIQTFNSATTDSKSPCTQSRFSSPPNGETIWGTVGGISSSITNEGECRDKGQNEDTFLKSPIDGIKKISSPELATIITELNDAVVTSGAMDDSFAVSQSEFMELSNSLLSYVGEGDLLYLNVDEKDMDRACLDGLGSIFLNSPKDVDQEDSSKLVEPRESAAAKTCSQIVDGGHIKEEDAMQPLDSDSADQCHVCDSEANVPSIPTCNFHLPEGVEIRNCILNTEDPNIPCNNDIFPSKPASRPCFPSIVQHNPDQIIMSNSFSDKETCNRRTSEPSLAVMRADLEMHGHMHVSPYVPGPSALVEIGLKDVGHCERVKVENLTSDSPSTSSMNASAGAESRKECIIAPSTSKTAKGLSLQDHATTPRPGKGDFCYSTETLDLEDSAAYAKSYPENAVNIKKHGVDSQLEVVKHATQLALAEQVTGGIHVSNTHEVGCLEQVTHVSTSDKEEQHCESEDDVPYFSDIETMILDMDLPPIDHDMFFAQEEIRYQHGNNRQEIMRLEKLATSYMQRAATRCGAFAVFYGRRLKHYITKFEVSLGRATGDVNVDIDLRREGRANKISRRQAIIKMEEDGSFYITNLGKKAISVNSKDIASGHRLCLGSGSLIEVRWSVF